MSTKKEAIERLVVVPRRFGGKKLFLVNAAVIGLIVVVIGFSIGMVLGEKFGIAQWQELVSVKQSVVDGDAHILSQDEELARLRIGAEIDRQALEEVRLTILSKEDELVVLNEELGFYQELMSSSPSKRGLTFHDLVVTATEVERQYKYKLVLKQLASRHNLLTIGIKMNVQGLQDNQQVILDFSEISSMFKQTEEVVKFRYFINFEGLLELPAGFEPNAISVSARSIGGSQKIESNVSWTIEER